MPTRRRFLIGGAAALVGAALAAVARPAQAVNDLATDTARIRTPGPTSYYGMPTNWPRVRSRLGGAPRNGSPGLAQAQGEALGPERLSVADLQAAIDDLDVPPQEQYLYVNPRLGEALRQHGMDDFYGERVRILGGDVKLDTWVMDAAPPPLSRRPAVDLASSYWVGAQGWPDGWGTARHARLNKAQRRRLTRGR